MGATRVSGGLRQGEEKTPQDPHRAVYSGVGVELYPDTMVGVLKVPSKGYGYSYR